MADSEREGAGSSIVATRDGLRAGARSEEGLPARGRLLGGRYRLRGVIGSGGMGAVYEADDVARGERVAVKVLRREPERGRSLGLRFEREAHAAWLTGHRGIVEVRDLGVEPDGTSYMVMELLRGESLASRLRRQGRLEPGLALHVARQVLAALAVAHDRGVLHRDVKPQNVFLVGGGPRPVVKVLDFGIAKLEGSDESLTEKGVVVGTPAYMAPEQALGREDLDCRVDLWAVGVVLFRCLTGAGPFEAATTAEILVRVVTGAAPSPSELGVELPAALEAAVVKALSRDRAGRYASARAMEAALAEALPEGEEVALAGGPRGPDPIPWDLLPARAEGPSPWTEQAPADPAEATVEGWGGLLRPSSTTIFDLAPRFEAGASLSD